MTTRVKKLRVFYRQVAAELHKVIWPTRKELRSSTITVIVFVVLTALFVVGVDYLAGQGVLNLYG